MNKMLRSPVFWLGAASMEAVFAFKAILKDEYVFAFLDIGFFLLYMWFRQRLLNKQKEGTK